DVSRGRRRLAHGSRQPGDRDHRSLQPPDRTDRAQHRRRQGAGVAGQRRSAVRHRSPPDALGRHRARRAEEVGNPMAAAELVEYVAKSLVDDPDAVKVEILSDRPEQRYAVGSVLHREGSDEPLTVVWSSAVSDGPGWRLQFAEVHDRSAAEDLKGSYLEIDAGPDAALPRGAYFWHEVVGTTVTATDGTVLGSVQDVYRSGGAEVYVISGGDFGEFDVPAVRDFIRIFAPRR